ncbi:pectate lyase [Candidatus Latescibacterota bacterium]
MKNVFLILILVFTIIYSPIQAEPSKNEVHSCLKKAVAYMMETVSTNGGFVWQYSEDMSERWGEVPARPSQIWVQGATNGVGELMLDAYHATGDTDYLDYAKRVADAIIWGQHSSGGWHYLIDFDMPGIRTWYDEVASKCWGWEEYSHYYGNCTYDNDVTGSSVRFLLHLYMTTLNPAYREPLLKGLDFILESQFPNGAWPQRYPLSHEYIKDGHPDYTSYYTFNDSVISTNIFLLVETWELLGDERYMEAARRGMDFYLIARGPDSQAAWAEQYDWYMRPAWGRTYEPGAYHASRTASCIRELLKFYRITSDRRYLDAVPQSIAWLEKSITNTDPSRKAERAGIMYPYTNAVYYEVATNRPVYVHREGTHLGNGRYFADYESGDGPCHVLQVCSIDTGELQRAYERTVLIPEEELPIQISTSNDIAPKKPTDGQVENVINTMDPNGSWITELAIQNYKEPCDISGRKVIKGISTKLFIRNVETMINHLVGK